MPRRQPAQENRHRDQEGARDKAEDLMGRRTAAITGLAADPLATASRQPQRYPGRPCQPWAGAEASSAPPQRVLLNYANRTARRPASPSSPTWRPDPARASAGCPGLKSLASKGDSQLVCQKPGEWACHRHRRRDLLSAPVITTMHPAMTLKAALIGMIKYHPPELVSAVRIRASAPAADIGLPAAQLPALGHGIIALQSSDRLVSATLIHISFSSRAGAGPLARGYA